MTASGRGVTWSGRHVVVTMPPELDITTAGPAADLLASVLDQRPTAVTADLTATQFCDSAGVHVLVRAHRLASEKGAEVRLAIGASPVVRILELTGLDQVLPVYAHVERSLAVPAPPERL